MVDLIPISIEYTWKRLPSHFNYSVGIISSKRIKQPAAPAS